jgi:photosystem II stability/assembly factor-like uncharacterized protein
LKIGAALNIFKIHEIFPIGQIFYGKFKYMSKKKKFFFITLLLASVFGLSGCGTTQTAVDTTLIDGGVFKSADKGSTWQQRVLIPTTTGAPKRFSAVSVASMVMDPTDPKAIYYGSISNGLLYTLDGAGSWQQVTELGNVTIRAIAIDAKSKCTIYAAVGNKVYKTTECVRGWQNPYYDNDLKTTIDAVAVDSYDDNNVYIGNSRGDVMKSTDAGTSWQTIERTNSKIDKIVIDPNDSRIMYVLTEGRVIFRTKDGGLTWDNDIAKALKELGINDGIKDAVFVKDEAKVVYVATEYGMAVSQDKGETWKKIELIPSNKSATINTITVNPRNSLEIYYVTFTTFYRSLDGGKTWSTIKLPTSRAGWNLIIDPQSPNIIYMAVRSFTKK